MRQFLVAVVPGLALMAGMLTMQLVNECSVGERAPSPSHGVTIDTPRPGSEAAPARSRPSNEGTTVPDGNGEDVVPVEETALAVLEPSQPGPASTVTQSALTGEGGMPVGPSMTQPYLPTRPTVTVSPTDGGAYIAPATPVATSRAPETLAPKSINSYDPWPAYLWPVVECLIQRESGGNPGAVGAAGERGLMQVGVANFTYLAERGIPPDSLFDPATNILAGWMIYLYWQNATGDGFWPWKSTRGGCA